MGANTTLTPPVVPLMDVRYDVPMEAGSKGLKFERSGHIAFYRGNYCVRYLGCYEREFVRSAYEAGLAKSNQLLGQAYALLEAASKQREPAQAPTESGALYTNIEKLCADLRLALGHDNANKV